MYLAERRGARRRCSENLMPVDNKFDEEGRPGTTLFEVLKERQVELLPPVVVAQIQDIAHATGWSVGLCAILFPYAAAIILGLVLIAAKKLLRCARATKEPQKSLVKTDQEKRAEKAD